MTRHPLADAMTPGHQDRRFLQGLFVKMGMECGALDCTVGGGVLVAAPSREAWDATASDDCAFHVLGRTFWPVPVGAFTCRPRGRDRNRRAVIRALGPRRLPRSF